MIHQIIKIILPENLAPLVAKVSEKYDHIVASANTFGKNFMPRVAAALDVSQVSDIIKVKWYRYFCKTNLCW